VISQAQHANLVAAVRSVRHKFTEGKEDQIMAKRKGKNLSAPAKDPKYEGRNNTKKMTTKKKG
jgi:hypothetical protein